MWEVETNWRWGVHVETFICRNPKKLEEKKLKKYRNENVTADCIKMTLSGLVHWF